MITRLLVLVGVFSIGASASSPPPASRRNSTKFT